MRSRLSLMCLIAAMATPLLACPVCDSGTGQQVRAGIMDDSFGLSVLATALPFIVVLGITAFIHFGLPQASKKHGHRD
jgi:hypothetical protein